MPPIHLPPPNLHLVHPLMLLQNCACLRALHQTTKLIEAFLRNSALALFLAFQNLLFLNRENNKVEGTSLPLFLIHLNSQALLCLQLTNRFVLPQYLRNP